ncbi:MAG: putative quinol monooxygenase [Pseudomonadota bacterium]
MIVIMVLGSIEIAEEEFESIRPAVTNMMEASSAESGCLHYSFSRDVSKPGLFHIIERWKSEEDLGAHFQTEHMARFNATLASVTIEKMDVRMYAGEEVRVMMQS